MEIEVKILKYGSLFTKRTKDLERLHWFSFPIELMTHPDMLDINGEEFKAFMWCVCIATKCKSDTVRLDTRHAARMIGTPEEAFRSMFLKLQSKQIDTALGRDAASLRPQDGLYITEQNITSHNNTSHHRTSHDITEGPRGRDAVVMRPQDQNETKKPSSSRSNKVQPRGCISEFSHDDICLERFASVTERAQKAWLGAYPSVDWIVHETRKAHAWCETNPQKAPKDFGRFMLTWLSRGFETYRKGLQSKPQTFQDRQKAHNDEVKRRLGVEP